MPPAETTPQTQQQSSRSGGARTACLACRQQKIKCVRPQDQSDIPCQRCERLGVSCTVTPRQLGRKKGSKNKYPGIAKALRILGASTNMSSNPLAPAIPATSLLDSSSATSSSASATSTGGPSGSHSSNNDIPNYSKHPLSNPLGLLAEASDSVRNHSSSRSSSVSAASMSPNTTGTGHQSGSTKCTTANNSAAAATANNIPNGNSNSNLRHKQLLLRQQQQQHQHQHQRQQDQDFSSATPDDNDDPAIASSPSPRHSSPPTMPESINYDSISKAASNLNIRIHPSHLINSLSELFSHSYIPSNVNEYFKERGCDMRPDNLPQFDPLLNNILTRHDVDQLFKIFFDCLQINIGILDPVLHTPDFVNSRSTFLFTAILAASSKFYTAPHASVLAARIEPHAYELAGYIMQHGYKSTEIIQAFQIITPWSSPTPYQVDDRTSSYISYAISMASEIGLESNLNYSLLPSIELRDCHHHQQQQEQNEQEGNKSSTNTSRSPTPNSELIQRIIRNRERTWLMLFCWDRGSAATHGRNGTMIENNLIKNVDRWWEHPLAVKTDRQTSALVSIRSKLSLMQDMLKRCHSEPVPDAISAVVNSHLEPWKSQWIQDEKDASNIILILVYHHTRLLLLSFACSGRLSSLDKSYKIFDACLSSAVESCQYASHSLDTEPTLHYAPSNVLIMLAYAATFAFKLIVNDKTSSISHKAAYVGLLAYHAHQLDRAGSTPSHRNGLSALYGKKLLAIIHKHLCQGFLQPNHVFPPSSSFPYDDSEDVKPRITPDHDDPEQLQLQQRQKQQGQEVPQHYHEGQNVATTATTKTTTTPPPPQNFDEQQRLAPPQFHHHDQHLLYNDKNATLQSLARSSSSHPHPHSQPQIPPPSGTEDLHHIHYLSDNSTDPNLTTGQSSHFQQPPLDSSSEDVHHSQNYYIDTFISGPSSSFSSSSMVPVDQSFYKGIDDTLSTPIAVNPASVWNADFMSIMGIDFPLMEDTV